MAIKDSLIKTILKQLNEIYPKSLNSSEDILPEHENREEILEYLFHCYKKGWIEAKPIEEDQRDIPVDYYGIRITDLGRDYLSSL